VSQQLKIKDELVSACNELGMSWAEGCPAFKTSWKSSDCIIFKWSDTLKSARYCINCPVSHDEAQVRVLMCKLRPQVKIDEQ